MDSRFGGSISAVSVEADGSILIGGILSSVTGIERFNLARLRGTFHPWLNPAVAPAPGGVVLTLFSQPGATYELQASTDLTKWVPVQTNVAVGTVLNLIAPVTPNSPQQFYRARQSTP